MVQQNTKSKVLQKTLVQSVLFCYIFFYPSPCLEDNLLGRRYKPNYAACNIFSHCLYYNCNVHATKKNVKRKKENCMVNLDHKRGELSAPVADDGTLKLLITGRPVARVKQHIKAVHNNLSSHFFSTTIITVQM